MKVLHVTSSYPLRPGDSTAPFMEEITQALAHRGHNIRVITPAAQGLQTGTRAGVEVTAYHYGPRWLQVWGYGRSLDERGHTKVLAVLVAPLAMGSMLRAIRRAMRSWKPDAVHLHWLIPQGVVAPLLPRWAPVLTSLHGADVGMISQSVPLACMARLALRFTDRLIAASGEMIDRVAVIEPDIRLRAAIIHHGANADLFWPASRDEARRRLDIPLEIPVVLAVGRLVAKKGFEHLIRALPLMQQTLTRAYVAGDGPLRLHLTEQAAERAYGRITFLGGVGRSELADWYAASDLVVVSSVHTTHDVDSGPVVLMEALASGRPVVSTPIGMAPDVIVDGVNGYLVPEADPAALAHAIDRALERSKELGRAAAESFARIGDWDRAGADLEDAYSAAIEHRRAHQNHTNRS